MRRNMCPCCSSPLLRHASSRGLYWFCTSCGQEMPIAPTPKILSGKDSLKKEAARKAKTLK